MNDIIQFAKVTDASDNGTSLSSILAMDAASQRGYRFISESARKALALLAGVTPSNQEQAGHIAAILDAIDFAAEFSANEVNVIAEAAGCVSDEPEHQGARPVGQGLPGWPSVLVVS